MDFYWQLLIPAFVLALFSDKIDIALKGDKKIKKLFVFLSVLLFVITVFFALKAIF